MISEQNWRLPVYYLVQIYLENNFSAKFSFYWWQTL